MFNLAWICSLAYENASVTNEHFQQRDIGNQVKYEMMALRSEQM